MKKIIFILMFICLALPCSAWEQSFEDHVEDVPDSDFKYDGAPVPLADLWNGKSAYLYWPNSGYNQYKYLEINQEWEGYLEFTYYHSASYAFYRKVGLILYDETGNAVFSDTAMYQDPVSSGECYHRIIFQENSFGTGIECYVDGVLSDSGAYLADFDSITKIKIAATEGESGTHSNRYIYFDDFTTEPGVITCDSGIEEDETYQYFHVGHPTYTGIWNVTLTDPSGTTIYNLGSVSPYYVSGSVSKSLMQKTGVYTFNLYYVNNNNPVLKDTRTFYHHTVSNYTVICPSSVSSGEIYRVFWNCTPYYTDAYLNIVYPDSSEENYNISSINSSKLFVAPSGTEGNTIVSMYSETDGLLATDSFILSGGVSEKTILFDKNTYSPGEMARITTEISPYASGYIMMFVYGENYIENTISTENQVFPMEIPLNIATNYIFCYIVDSYGDVVAYDQAEIEGMTSEPVIKLDKTSYSPSDSIEVQYWYMPIGTDLTATYYLNGVKKTSSTIQLNDVIGVEYFTIGGRDADSVIITAHSNTEAYCSISADILWGNYHVSGKVFDTITGATVSDAVISTTAFTVTTDENGAFNHSVTPGQIYVTISADGYHNLHTSMYLVSPATVKNFYIIPEYTSGDSSVFGVVVDYYNGSGIQGALLKIQQNTTTYTALTSKKGYFIIDEPEMSGTWMITVSKSGYESYSKSISVSGDTYEDISLVPVGGASPESGSSVPGSSDSPTYDRPGRQAAKDSMAQLESIIPGLISFVVLVVFIQLIKEM